MQDLHRPNMNNSIQLDDVPVPSVERDFIAILEECLKKQSNIPEEEKTPVKKFSYLKKGQGIARFYSNSPKVPRRRSICTKQATVSVKTTERKKSSSPKQKPQTSKSLVPTNATKNLKQLEMTLNTSEEKNIKKEIEENHLFEYMERKTQNSSFNSTSSEVVAFLHHSSPFKSRVLMEKISQERYEVNIDQQAMRNNQWENLASFNHKEITQKESLEDIVGDLPYGMDNAHIYEATNDLKKSGPHVRFSNQNEYRTYGLSDNSSLDEASRGQVFSSDDETSSFMDTLQESEKEMALDEKYEYDGSEDDEEEEEEEDEDEEEDTSLKVDDMMTLEMEDDCIEKEKSDLLFKSDLLKTRLMELEHEIEVFRKENASLKKKQLILDKEYKNFQEDVKDGEKKIAIERQRIDNYLQEEKKLIAREKNALDMRLKNAHENAQKNGREREKMKGLKKQLDELKESMSQKEDKWNALQGRYKSQLRVLQTENTKLKQDIDKLQESQNSRTRKNQRTSSAKVIHRIGKILDRKQSKYAKSTEELIDESPCPEVIQNEERDDPIPVEEEVVPAEEVIEEVQDVFKNCKAKLVTSEAEEEGCDLKTNSNLEKLNGQNISEITHCDDFIRIVYQNGTVTKVFPSKQLTKKTILYNGDVREKYKDGKIRYFYSSNNTWYTTLPDGTEVVEFHDGQKETRWKDGTIEVTYPNGLVSTTTTDGTQKWLKPDGTIVESSAEGDDIFTLANGQREIHTKNHKRLEYPDGTVRLVYTNGVQETRYANGKVRIKDADGNVL